jgi:hypothetical protein
MFEDVFRDIPVSLQREREEMRALLEAQRSADAKAPAQDSHGAPPIAHEG